MKLKRLSKTTILSLVFLFVGISLCGQGVVKGRVLDERGKPVAGAMVSVQGTTVMTATNVDGYYELYSPIAKCAVEVNYSGKVQIIPVELIPGAETNLEIIRIKRKGVEKNIFGIQVGTGANIYNELKLTDDESWRLQVEGGLTPVWYNLAGAVEGYYYNVSGMVIYPISVTSEFRSYFNMRKRIAANKKTHGNAADYFALGVKFCPPISITDYGNIGFVGGDRGYSELLLIQLALGGRRSIGRHFNIEAETGIGSNLNYFSVIDPSINFGQSQTVRLLEVLSGYVSLKIGFDLSIRN